ncbi:MAG: restriction endonuclease subunit S [Bacteroidetes bacterium]|nr:restriction endonuclease subunit S [Bacteroidota bacterium]
MTETIVTDIYKQTEVGLIPSDWEVKELGKLGKFSKGSGVRKDEALSGDIPCVRYGELYTRHNDYIKQFYSFISKEISETAKKLKLGDILFAGSGETKEEIGKSVAFINEFEAYAGGDIVILSPNNIEPLYLGYLLNAPLIQKQKANKGQGDAVVHISASQLGNVKIPVPPTKAEQTAIASALSDADALISSLETLIAKKRNIKQGAMQRLLEPKEGCEVRKLGEIAEIVGGGTPSSLEISPNKIKQIEISIPAYEEQTRIAAILSEMDAEITALETKLEKYKKVKLGMMQELLTGRIRLV